MLPIWAIGPDCSDENHLFYISYPTKLQIVGAY